MILPILKLFLGDVKSKVEKLNERHPLDLLVDIKGFDNMDYLEISKELINDSIFLFSLNYEL